MFGAHPAILDIMPRFVLRSFPERIPRRHTEAWEYYGDLPSGTDILIGHGTSAKKSGASRQSPSVISGEISPSPKDGQAKVNFSPFVKIFPGITGKRDWGHRAGAPWGSPGCFLKKPLPVCSTSAISFPNIASPIPHTRYSVSASISPDACLAMDTMQAAPEPGGFSARKHERAGREGSTCGHAPGNYTAIPSSTPPWKGAGAE